MIKRFNSCGSKLYINDTYPYFFTFLIKRNILGEVTIFQRWRSAFITSWCCFWLFCVQYRAPFMPPTQQYPVTSGTASFYPGTSPAEYPPYGEFSPQQTQPPNKATKVEQTSTRFVKRTCRPRTFHIPSLGVDCADLVGRRVRFNTTVCGEMSGACGLDLFCFGLFSFYLQSYLTLPYRFHEMNSVPDFSIYLGW